jgi:hypothetical protein
LKTLLPIYLSARVRIAGGRLGRPAGNALKYTWAYFRAGPGKEKARQKMPAQARPDPTVEPEISAQAQPVESFFCQAVGLSGRAFLKSSNFLAQAQPS